MLKLSPLPAAVPPECAWLPVADDPLNSWIGRCGSTLLLDFPEFATFWWECSSTVVQVSSRTDPETLVEVFERGAMPLLLQARGTEVLHASAVVVAGGVVGFCGESQSGKSTLARGLAGRGFPVWADDALAFSVSERGPWTQWLPSRLRLRPEARAFFGEDGPTWKPDLLPKSLPLAGLFVVRPDRIEQHRQQGLSGLTGLLALLPHAYCFDPSDAARLRNMVEHYCRLVEAVPICLLRVSQDFTSFESLLDRVEEMIAQPD